MSVKPYLENYNIENFIKSIKTQKPLFLSLNCEKRIYWIIIITF